jgi:branched-subunit amino acid ABC-type transport system permease component
MSDTVQVLITQILIGVTTGLILALVASGLTLIFGIMDVVNFAHGELFMLGAYLGWVFFALTGNFWVGLMAAPVFIFFFGIAMHITTLRPLVGRDPLTTILATFGVSLVLQTAALWVWGPKFRKIDEPITGGIQIFHLQMPYYRMMIALFSVAIIGGVWVFIQRGRFGLWIRAVTQDRMMATAMGIPVPLVHTVVFGIGSAMAAISGYLYAPILGVDPHMGLNNILRAFIIVVVGGMGNLWGTVMAAIMIGVLEAVAATWVSAAQAIVFSFAVLVVTLLFRPRGLFASAER